jgi:hypothetical protein
MTMNFHPISLLPWIESDASIIGLTLAKSGIDPDLSGEYPFPFQVLSDSSSLTLLLRASFTFPGGGELKPIFLVVQKNSYPIPPSSFPTLSNTDIDTLWAEAYRLLKNTGTRFLDFAGEGGSEETAPWYKSLFYCRTLLSYFHPPCPACGEKLGQCHDDALLQAKGLKPYSSSIRRYLFCSSCGADSSFYVDELEPLDPPFLKNRSALFDEWNRLVVEDRCADLLPCGDCRHQNTCHGSEKHYRNRLIPFSFFDFHMLAMEAGDLSVPDFAALASGASISDLLSRPELISDGGRATLLQLFEKKYTEGTEFFFSSGKKIFLEVLYLKICLLRQIFNQLFSLGYGDRTPGVFRSPDQFWVKLHGGDNRLPWLWNFEVLPMDVIYWTEGESETPFGTSAGDLDFWGRIWFGLLVGNRRQAFSEISHRTTKLKQEFSEGHGSFSVRGEQPDFLRPENIFWCPEEFQVGNELLALWHETLDAGLELLQGCARPEQWNAESFIAHIDQLLFKIRAELFEGASSESLSEAAKREDDSAIAAILTGVLARWESEPPQGPEPVVAEAQKPEPSREVIEKKPPQSAEFGDLDKTTILNVNETMAAIGRKEDSVQGKVGSDIPSVVPSVEVSTQPAEVDDIDKTTILNVNEVMTAVGRQQPQARFDTFAETQSAAQSDDDLNKKGINQAMEMIENPLVSSEGDAAVTADKGDDLSETVIINPEELARRLGQKKG